MAVIGIAALAIVYVPDQKPAGRQVGVITPPLAIRDQEVLVRVIVVDMLQGELVDDVVLADMRDSEVVEVSTQNDGINPS